MSKEVPQQIISGPVLVLVGPTAIGKTALSLSLSKQFRCEIVSMDSMQVYRYMDIGTAKVTPTERSNVPHHLIDIVNPDEDYNAHQYGCDSHAKIVEIHKRSAIPLLTGGTGFYLRSLRQGFFPAAPIAPEIRESIRAEIKDKGPQALHEEMSSYDQESAEKIHPNDTSRIVRAVEIYRATGMPLSAYQKRSGVERQFEKMLTIGLRCERDDLYQRINTRTRKMVEGGLEEEVLKLVEMGYGPGLKPMQSIGYRHMLQYLKGAWSKQEMIETLSRDTRRYAKRQYTWFKSDDSIQWFHREDHPGVSSGVERWLSEHE